MLAAKYFAQRLLQLPTGYITDQTSRKSHIFLFSTRRSGSTLLRDMIYSQPGFNYVDQPLDLTSNQYNPYRNVLPKPAQSQFISLSPNEEKMLTQYFNHVLHGEYVVRSQWSWFHRDFKRQWSRYVVKILNGKPLIEWFEKQFDAEIMYSLRHPIATALSILERGWKSTEKAYLSNENFVEANLSSQVYAKSKDISDSGTNIEKHLLGWCLENYVPMRLWPHKPWLIIPYEWIVLDTKKTAKLICEHFQLPDQSRMVQTAMVPSRSPGKSKKTAGNADPKDILSRWRTRVEKSELRKFSDILELFEISLYNAYDVLPSVRVDSTFK